MKTKSDSEPRGTTKRRKYEVATLIYDIDGGCRAKDVIVRCASPEAAARAGLRAVRRGHAMRKERVTLYCTSLSRPANIQVSVRAID